MISPHTAPGTKVVCVDNGEHNDFMHSSLHTMVSGCLDGLTAQKTYTVRDIRPCFASIGGFEVRLVEILRPRDDGYSLRRFRLASLPRCLTDCLTSAPVDADRVSA